MKRYVCIHGHFYQPPRENPWLETIETQDSAAPFHDWNERINAECYSVNAASRILDGKDRILAIVNNYSRMSFNFGPTLLSWMEKQDPDTYRAIIESDKESRDRFSGHGNALAQVFNHIIMPLANLADKRTQVYWGVKDFERRFGRRPEGMWLAETAVDLETLEVLAEEGIQFTILSPHQAHRIRPRQGEKWQKIGDGGIDTSCAYRQVLPSGKSISLFFYNGTVARAVAFEGLLRRAEYLVDRLLGAFQAGSDRVQLSHIATDGESYGHHHRFGDMALAYAFSLMEKRTDVSLTNYGEFLEKHPPEWDVEIAEGTSWSCCHGVERWRSDCGCNATATRGWNQAWRGPLRDALDWLRDSLIPWYEEKGKLFFRDPWAARNEYISVLSDRSTASVDRFLAENALPGIGDRVVDRTIALQLMELQRNALYMYTSCGWFFDELSGIETVQILRYAGRAIQLAEEILDCRIEERFLTKMKEAKSNLPERGTGADIYRQEVNASRIQLENVVAHYAICTLFQSFPPVAEVHCYKVESLDRQEYQMGEPRLATGRLRIVSRITEERADLIWGVLHFGDHNLLCGVRQSVTEEEYQSLKKSWQGPAEQADLTQIIRLLESNFRGAVYSLRSLFRDERRRLIHLILQSRLEATADIYRKIYRDNLPLMRLLSELAIPQPAGFRASAEFALNTCLQECFAETNNSPDSVLTVIQEAERAGIHLDYTLFIQKLEEKLEQLILQVEKDSQNLESLISLRKWAETSYRLPVKTNPSRAQIICHRLMLDVWPQLEKEAATGAVDASLRKKEFRCMAECLGFSPVLFD